MAEAKKKTTRTSARKATVRTTAKKPAAKTTRAAPKPAPRKDKGEGAAAVQAAIIAELERRQPGRGADDRTPLVIRRLKGD
jgi:hypothetical protein